jgi:hypothetical protein
MGEKNVCLDGAMVNVWGTTASVGRDASEFDEVPFHQTRVTREFLDRGDRKFFVCGLKGIGKTLLLKKKSQEVRRNQPGVTFLPPTELVEKLNPLVHSMSAKDHADLSVPTGWSRVWQFVLALAIIKRLAQAPDSEDRLPPDVKDAFPAPDSSVSYHVDKLLAMGASQRRRMIERHLAELLSILREVQHGVYVFIDAIDDCVYTHVGASFRRFEEGTTTQFGVLSPEIWRAAQVGFVQAAVGLHEAHRHLKIFGALRKEALDAGLLSDRQNLEAYLLLLEYSRDDLRGIFTTKLTALRQQMPGYFADPDDADIVKGFFGFSVLPHPTVTVTPPNALEEPVLDYIIRHSRGRPRELDMIGESLQLISELPRDPEEVRRRVRDKSRAWFEWAKSEMIPYWDERYDRLLSALPSNVLTKSQSERILSEVNGWDEGAKPFLELFELGLVGCPVADEENGEVQRFRQNDPTLPVSAQQFTAATHYIIHPCVNLATRTLKTVYQADPHNVAGHGYHFLDVQRPRHVHFGAGSLGAGLVLPILGASRGSVVCVIQRNSDRWKRAEEWGDKCDVTYQYRPGADAIATVGVALQATVVLDSADADVFGEKVEKWSDGGAHLFLITDDADRIGHVLSRATSVSTALRALDSIESAAAMIVRHGSTVKAVYPFENSEESVAQIEKMLRSANVPVIRVSADRICVDSRLTNTGLTVDTEDYFSVVVNDESTYTKALYASAASDDRHRIVFESDKTRFELMREAKRYLVNGLHFAYVLYAFRLLKSRFRDKETLVEMLVSNPVSELLGLSPEVQNSLDQVANLYIIHLLVQAEEKGLIRETSDLETWHRDMRARYDAFGDRLSSTRDQLDRILKRDIRAIAERVERFVAPMQGLAQRIRRTKYCRVFFEAEKRDYDGIEHEATSYKADCVELFGYLRDPQVVKVERPAKTRKRKAGSRKGGGGR